MIYLTCPYCGPRDVTEFRYGSDAHIARPKQPGALGDRDWADYLFMKDNPKGLMRERWMHAHGCRRWFNAVRNTVTDEVVAVYRMGDPPMALDATVGRPATAESDARPELKVLPADPLPADTLPASANSNPDPLPAGSPPAGPTGETAR